MTDYKHGLIVIIWVSILTIITRIVPVLIFGKGRKVPKYILYLGEVVPYTAMGLLIVYCLKDVQIFNSPYALPEIIGVAVVVISYLWKRNSILSVVIGTILYMFLNLGTGYII